MSVLDDALMELLACPRCKGPLERNPNDEGLRCPACRLDFPVREGLPILLLEEVRPDT